MTSGHICVGCADFTLKIRGYLLPLYSLIYEVQAVYIHCSLWIMSWGHLTKYIMICCFQKRSKSAIDGWPSRSSLYKTEMGKASENKVWFQNKLMLYCVAFWFPAFQSLSRFLIIWYVSIGSACDIDEALQRSGVLIDNQQLVHIVLHRTGTQPLANTGTKKRR